MGLFSNLFGTPAVSMPAETPAAAPAASATSGVQTPAVPATPAGEVDPLAQFNTLWQPPEQSKDVPQGPAPVDTKKLMEAASKVDFSKAVTPELMAQIQAGGDGAMAAMMQAMNRMSQQTYAQSAFATDAMIKQALAQAQVTYDGKLPEMMRQLSAKQSLQAENPVFSNPAVKPIMEAVQAQLAVKNPNATPNELTSLTKDFILAISGAVAPQKGNNSKANTPEDQKVDWAGYWGQGN